MKWPKRREKPDKPEWVAHYIKGMGPDNNGAIPIRIVGPVNINHTVMHEPYPRPNLITITFYDNEGRSWQMPPHYVRGGSHIINNTPQRFAGQEWVRYEIDIRYGE